MQSKVQAKRTADIRKHLLRQIEIGNFSRGAVLPSERELAEQLDASYMTIRKAIGQLVDECYLERIPRVGTFVSSRVPVSKVLRQLGIIIPAWTAPENSDFIMYASEAAEQNGWLPKLYFARHWEDRTLTDAWQNSDALLCVPPQSVNRMPDDLLERFRSHEKPVVLIGVPAYHFGLDTVAGAVELELGMLLDRLAQAGHTRIALVEQYTLMNDQLELNTPTFYSVWKQWITENLGSDAVSELGILVETPRFELPHRAIYEKLKAFGCTLPFSAIITRVPFIWGVTAALTDLGFRIPEDVSLVSNGDRQEVPFYRPKLSYLQVPLRDHAYKALELIQLRSQNPSLPVQYMMIQPVFIEGETLKTLKHSNHERRTSCGIAFMRKSGF
ncbi:MAG: GntR family transcriptional regulator [Victivallales bacterium]